MSTEQADLSSLRIERQHKNEVETTTRKVSYLKPVGIVLSVIVLIIIAIAVKNTVFSKTIDVKLVTAEMRSPSDNLALLSASGYVVAQRKAAVASKGTGLMVYLAVKEGDKVKKDQIIARLQDDDIKAQLEAAKATLSLNQSNLNEVKNTYERQKKLYDSGSATQSDLESAESNYNKAVASIDLAKAQLTSAQVALENTVIRAPFDGTVLTKDADVGEMVAPFAAGANARAAVVSIADLGSLQVETDVSEANIEKITLNEECEIELDAYPSRRYSGFVASIVPTADRAKGTVLVKVGFQKYDERVLPEMSAKVLFLKQKETQTVTNEPPVLVLPDASIANRNGKSVVYIITDKKAKEVVVTTGIKFDGFTEIKSGIHQGDRVIQNFDEKITDGVKVNTD